VLLLYAWPWRQNWPSLVSPVVALHCIPKLKSVKLSAAAAAGIHAIPAAFLAVSLSPCVLGVILHYNVWHCKKVQRIVHCTCEQSIPD